jgi:NADH-quinone oxidoreductase subunit E
MLTDEEKREIDSELGHYPTRQAVCIEALKIVQRQRGGWVSDISLAEVAGYLGMSDAELDGVASFYNLIFRKPVGRHMILVCNSISCWIMGYGELRTGLMDRLDIDLGQTTADGRFTLLPIVCLGTCDHAPALMIGDDLYRDVKTADLDDILVRYP